MSLYSYEQHHALFHVRYIKNLRHNTGYITALCTFLSVSFTVNVLVSCVSHISHLYVIAIPLKYLLVLTQFL